MRVLVIPDCHLKPWMFEKATAIMSGERTDNAVCLMDIPDDFGKDDPDLYKKTYDAAIRFAGLLGIQNSRILFFTRKIKHLHLRVSQILNVKQERTK